ncbi:MULTISPECIES: nucleotidyltransferase domain-containing protein [Cohnella]|mgnify:CR=1 FL=1|uniref:nucleotidyltransferase domain-containing protein n=1 Tax=Cohnella TaxID=329857 RepID=UPI0009BB48DA|nr:MULTISPECIES: nucleotidyltransferase domain-containing protein [Cohnella]MBN2980416.1 nucleotidyltransferase domain-containing protein [Cohnella algarum]
MGIEKVPQEMKEKLQKLFNEYGLREGHLYADLSSGEVVVRTNKASPEDLQLAKIIADIYAERDPENIERIVLFGSRARGDSGASSDFDILILVEEDSKDIRSNIRAGRRHSSKFPIVDLDLLICTNEDFRKSTIYESVLREGIVLYER